MLAPGPAGVLAAAAGAPGGRRRQGNLAPVALRELALGELPDDDAHAGEPVAARLGLARDLAGEVRARGVGPAGVARDAVDRPPEGEGELLGEAGAFAPGEARRRGARSGTRRRPSRRC